MTLVAEQPSLADRRAAAAASLASLEREQAVAILDGKPFDAKALVECREQLAALAGAETEQVRRDRAAVASLGAEQRAETRKAMSGTLEAYVAAIERAETAGRAMVDEFKQADAMADHLRRQIRSLGSLVPTSLDPNETRLKHSTMLATILRTLGRPNRFGCMEWNSVPPIPDWKAHVDKFVAPTVTAYIQGE